MVKIAATFEHRKEIRSNDKKNHSRQIGKLVANEIFHNDKDWQLRSYQYKIILSCKVKYFATKI